MKTKQTIAVIGANGNLASVVSKGLSKGNYRLLLCANEYWNVESLARQIKSDNPLADVEVIDCNKQASWEADIIITAVPFQDENAIAEQIRDVANQKIVFSIADPMNETFDGLVTAPYISAAEELQKLLPNSKVVKAFNTTFATDFSKPVIDGKQIDAFIAGNDETALQIVAEIIASIGFNPVIAGDLSVSRTLENMQLYMYPIRHKVQQQLISRLKNISQLNK